MSAKFPKMKSNQNDYDMDQPKEVRQMPNNEQ